MAKITAERLIKLLRKRERIQREAAYPPEGQLWQGFKNIAEFDPEAAERLTRQEYGIRQAPYEAGVQYREQIEQARAQMIRGQQKLATQLEREKQRKRKAEALQKIWVEEKPEWTPERVKLELQRQGLQKYYKKPIIPKIKEKLTIAERINRFLKRTIMPVD